MSLKIRSGKMLPGKIFCSSLAAFILMSVLALAQDMDRRNTDHSKTEHSKMSHHDDMDHSKMDHDSHADHDMSSIEPAAPMSADGPVISAKVNGLVCDFCAQALRKVFKKEAAVEDISVDLDAGLVNINLKDGQSLEDGTVKKLIRKSGYSLVSIERSGGA